jgi:hypothetical protein
MKQLTKWNETDIEVVKDYLKNNMSEFVQELIRRTDYINLHKEELFKNKSVNKRRKRVGELIMEYDQVKNNNTEQVNKEVSE